MSSEGFAGSMLHDSFGNLGPAPPLPSVTLFRLSHCNPACQGQGLGPGEGQGVAGRTRLRPAPGLGTGWQEAASPVKWIQSRRFR